MENITVHVAKTGTTVINDKMTNLRYYIRPNGCLVRVDLNKSFRYGTVLNPYTREHFMQNFTALFGEEAMDFVMGKLISDRRRLNKM